MFGLNIRFKAPDLVVLVLVVNNSIASPAIQFLLSASASIAINNIKVNNEMRLVKLLGFRLIKHESAKEKPICMKRRILF